MNEVYKKEIESGKTELAVNGTVKTKAKSFIRKYMSSKGPVFRVNSPISDPVLGSHDTDSPMPDAGSLPDDCMNVISDA